MGWATVPGEKEAAKTAKMWERKHPGCGASLLTQWTEIAATPCALCGEPIGRDRPYYLIDRDNMQSPGKEAHASCVWEKHEREEAEAEKAGA